MILAFDSWLDRDNQTIIDGDMGIRRSESTVALTHTHHTHKNPKNDDARPRDHHYSFNIGRVETIHIYKLFYIKRGF